jgi:anaerobic magnesium-protoporphyrin IX monomethyl ester cyclase
MAKRIFLIYPPSLSMNREDRCQIPVKNVVIEPIYPPMDLLSLAAVAEAEDCTCKVSDYSRIPGSADLFFRDLREFSPDILVLSVTTPTLDADLGLCSAVKKILPSVKIFAKGAHFLKFSREALERFAALDLVIRGETEHTFREILGGAAPDRIAGITWRGPEGIVVNQDRPFIEDLDQLPFPARHLVDKNRYLMPRNNRPMGVIRVSRGCPYHCFFCLATAVSGKMVRKRSPGNIVEELKICVSTYGIRDFVFYSDVFNLDRDWVWRLCDQIMAAGLKISWSSNVRLNAVDLETAQLMKRAGCSLTSFGVESGSTEVLKKMGKQLELRQIKESVRILKQAGLETCSYIMVGLPWDTHRTVEETIRLAIDLDCDYSGIFTATPFPGTRFFDYALEHGLFDEGQGPGQVSFAGAYQNPTVRGHYLSKDAIAALHRRAIRKYFYRTRYIVKNVLKVRSWNELLGYSRAALSLIKFRST